MTGAKQEPVPPFRVVKLREEGILKGIPMESMILDDGWQIEDHDQGCGGWKPAPSKLSDMAGFVRDMHGLGLRVMLWYGVPFIGERSENFTCFQDMLVDPEAKRQWHVLDPRYPASVNSSLPPMNEHR